MARAAAQGHRVVLVLATDGGLGLAAAGFHGGEDLATVRLREAHASAAALGVSRIEWLGYADSGLGDDLYADPPGRVRFVNAPVAQAADAARGHPARGVRGCPAEL
jgi:LmbE family N-acetylglucosaminyl deacetylase